MNATRAGSELALVLCDGARPEESLARAAALRRAGRTFAVGLTLDDPAIAFARRAGATILRTVRDRASRAQAFAALAADALVLDGRPLRDHEIADPATLATLREFLKMGDAVRVRSQAERASLERRFNLRIRRALMLPVEASDVPTQAPDADADRVCLWAPDLDPRELAVHVQALEELGLRALIVCAAPNPGLAHDFTSPGDAARALRRARVVVDANATDPGAAIALARAGARLCHALSSGAHEYVEGGVAYDPLDAADIRDAIRRAAGLPTSRVHALPSVDEAARRLFDAVPPGRADDPLVSVVIPTYNRPAQLRRALENVARQTYARVEVVVVNDGGEAVDDVVADFPNVVLLSLPENVGVSAAMNAGLRAATGAYLAAIADDDRHYPTHLAYLVHAARASGLDVAHSDVVNNLVHPGPAGELLTSGYHLSHDGDLDPIAVRWSMTITAQSFLISREAYAAIGYWEEKWPVVGDYDILLRLSRAYDFAHVPVVTGEFRVRDDGSTLSNRSTDRYERELAALFARHAMPERPLVTRRQAETYAAAVRRKRAVAAFFSAHRPLHPPRRVES